MNNSKVVFIISRSHLKNLFNKFFSKDLDFYVEEILAGFIENFLSNLYKNKVISKIKSIGPKLVFECFITENKYNFETDKKYFSIKQEFSVSSWLKSFIFSKNIGPNSDGTFSMGRIYAVSMPWFFGIDYLLSLLTDDCDFRDTLAKMEGGILVKLNLIGAPISKSIIMSKLLMTFGSAGLGRFVIIDLKKGLFKMSCDFDENFSMFYSKEDLFSLKRNICFFLCGAYEFLYNINVEFNFDGTIVHLKKLSDGRVLSDVEKEIDKNLTLKNFMFKI
ncbi:MAG: hypothetical protein HRU03_05800 [Nanoarchaeales archaeon]|nr:hypothetical protein [Nanoarchaeales archaeon]